MSEDAGAVEPRVARLEAAVESLLARIQGVEGSLLHEEPAEGDWSVMKILGHVSEVLPYWSRVATEVAATPGAPLGRPEDDPDRLAAVNRYAEATLDDVLPAVRAGLATATARMRSIPATGWARAGRHSRFGAVTVGDIFDRFVIGHIEDHGRQAQAVLDSLISY